MLIATCLSTRPLSASSSKCAHSGMRHGPKKHDCVAFAFCHDTMAHHCGHKSIADAPNTALGLERILRRPSFTNIVLPVVRAIKITIIVISTLELAFIVVVRTLDKVFIASRAPIVAETVRVYLLVVLHIILRLRYISMSPKT